MPRSAASFSAVVALARRRAAARAARPIACISAAGSRVLVERTIYDDFVTRLAERFAKLTAGTPEMDLDLGPLINLPQKRRVERYLQQAAHDGQTDHGG